MTTIYGTNSNDTLEPAVEEAKVQRMCDRLRFVF